MLYIIPTPIGNLDDITLRALKLFKQLDYFICEDTRTFKKLLNAYEIDYTNKKFFSLTSYTNTGVIKKYINLIQNNNVGLVSEAGTPGLSDPGKELIKLCRENNIKFDILPGANALIPAIIGACFPTNEFRFIGFLPQKKGRITKLKEIFNSKYPTFFYESVHRIEKLLNQLKELNFSGKILIAREISKKFEEYICNDFEKIYKKFQNKNILLKGEFVIGLYPCKLKKEEL